MVKRYMPDDLGPENKMLTATIVGIMIQMLIDQGLTDTAIANMFSRRKVREIIKVVKAKGASQ